MRNRERSTAPTVRHRLCFDHSIGVPCFFLHCQITKVQGYSIQHPVCCVLLSRSYTALICATKAWFGVWSTVHLSPSDKGKDNGKKKERKRLQERRAARRKKEQSN
ncbi:hypothetical protein ACMFMF_003539 [Clarireedia jacksonii]